MTTTHYKQDEIIEMVQFFCFSCRPDSDFNGTIQFSFSKDKNDKEKFDLSVRIHNQQVVVFYGQPPDKNVNLKLTMSTDDFFFVYSGKASGMDITQMILSGRIKSSTFRVGDVSKFAKSFDFSSEKWSEFYSFRGTNPTQVLLPERGSILVTTEDIKNLQKVSETKTLIKEKQEDQLIQNANILEMLKMKEQSESQLNTKSIEIPSNPFVVSKDIPFNLTKNSDCDFHQMISSFKSIKYILKQIRTEIRIFTVRRLFTRTLPFGSTQYNDISDWWLMSRSIKNEYIF